MKRLHAAKLYGQGYTRGQIARVMVKHLVGPKTSQKPLEQQLVAARSRLRAWEIQESFRDLIWNQAVVDLDLETPAILGGLAKKAKRGRVDAARLAMEITGRHNPKGDAVPAQVVVAINGIPRPARHREELEVEGTAIEEDVD